MSEIKEHMKIVGKDGAAVGTVDKVEGDRIKLTKKDNPEGHKDHHHYIDRKLVGLRRRRHREAVGQCRSGPQAGSLLK